MTELKRDTLFKGNPLIALKLFLDSSYGTNEMQEPPQNSAGIQKNGRRSEFSRPFDSPLFCYFVYCNDE